MPVLDSILGKPGAGTIQFSGESVLQERKSPWENKQAVTIDLRLWIHCAEDDLKLHFGLAR